MDEIIKDEPGKKGNSNVKSHLLAEVLDNLSEGVMVIDREWTLVYVNQPAAAHAGFEPADLIGRNLWEKFPKIPGTLSEAYYRKAMTEREPQHFEIQGIVATRRYEITVNPSSAGITVLLNDITERKEAEMEMHQLDEKRQYLLSLSQVIIAEKDLNSLLSKVAKAALALSGGRMAATGYGYINGRFTAGGAYWIGGESPRPPGGEFKMDQGGIYQELIQSRESILLTQEQLVKHLAWGLPPDHPPLNGLLGARLTDENGQADGIIMVSDKAAGEFTALDEHFLKQLAAIASLALQHIEDRHQVEQKAQELEVKVKERTWKLARANEQLKQYGHRITQVQEEERKRIAYELHDDTAQYLSILKLELDSLLQSGKIQDPEIIKKLQYLEKDAGRAVDDVRRYSHELRPGVLDHLGLLAALEQIAGDINKLKQISVEINMEGTEPELTDEVKLGFFRIAQEALNNSRKHAKAGKSYINLQFQDDTLRMTVIDDGTGFNYKEAFSRAGEKGSMGLMSMRERAKLMGATLRVDSKPGMGTRVIVEMPW